MRQVSACVLVVMLSGPVVAEGSGEPGWPCIQRKQPNLSVGQLWSGPMPDSAVKELARRADILALAQVLEQRRISMEEAETLIGEFANSANDAELSALFQAAFDRIDAYRSQIMIGIEQYAAKQISLSNQIEARRVEMVRLEAAGSPDFDKIDAEEKMLDWDTRIFTDRQLQLTYVCETPVLLEQRAFALAKAVAVHLD